MELRDQIDILINEYNAVKEEERAYFSHGITCLNIWLTFSGVFLGAALTFFSELLKQEISPYNNETFRFLIFVILPCLHTFFGLMWVDFITRFVKEGYYLLKIEIQLKIISSHCEKNLFVGFEHYISQNSKLQERLLSLLYYGSVLIFFIFVPMGILSTYKADALWPDFTPWVLIVNFMVDIVVSVLYIYNMFYMSKLRAKDASDSPENNPLPSKALQPDSGLPKTP